MNSFPSKICFIHIGPHKTGTSSLQSVFYDEFIISKTHDILYPTTGLYGDRSHNSLGLAIAHARELEFINMLNKLEQEIQNTSCNNLLISSEIFEKCIIPSSDTMVGRHVLMKKMLTLIKQYYDNICIIHCNRNQIDTWDSIFKQNIASGNSIQDIQRFKNHHKSICSMKIVEEWLNAGEIDTLYSYTYTSKVNPLDVFGKILNVDLTDKPLLFKNMSIDGVILPLVHFYIKKNKQLFKNNVSARSVCNCMRNISPELIYANTLFSKKEYEELSRELKLKKFPSSNKLVRCDSLDIEYNYKDTKQLYEELDDTNIESFLEKLKAITEKNNELNVFLKANMTIFD